ncbi:hypothetical protein AMTRI_Chr13g117120 [Amborella trichopoda]
MAYTCNSKRLNFVAMVLVLALICETCTSSRGIASENGAMEEREVPETKHIFYTNRTLPETPPTPIPNPDHRHDPIGKPVT